MIREAALPFGGLFVVVSTGLFVVVSTGLFGVVSTGLFGVVSTGLFGVTWSMSSLKRVNDSRLSQNTVLDCTTVHL